MNKYYYLTKRDEKILLSAIFESNFKNIDEKIKKILIEKDGYITEDLQNNNAYIYIKDEDYNYDSLVEMIRNKIFTRGRNYQLNLDSFKTNNLLIEDVLKAFYSQVTFYEFNLFNKKKEQTKKNNYTFLIEDNKHLELAKKLEIIASNRNIVRNLQVMPENFLNSEKLADFIQKDFSEVKNVKITVLGNKELEELKMNLILSVNKGSTHEARVVVLEYNGNPDSEEKTVLVGKGITFDTGGVNTKGYHMEGMKYDMSGSVIVAYALKTIAQLEAKVNVAAIMCITDNRLDGDASLPENVYESMSGLSVEVVDTDAEGRLVLADGLYYGAEKLKATLLIDVATLTGSIISALGNTYSGIYSTDDKKWELFEKASKIAHEKIWRMPLHDDFHEPNLESITADLNNYSNSETSDSNTAAMFLKQFTKDVPFIHCDIAGTADIKGKPQGVLVDTLVEFLLSQK